METKQAATNGLAVVGFITLLLLAIVLAGNAAKFVPTLVNGAVNGLSATVIGVTSIFIPAEGDIIVVGTSTTTPTTNFPIILNPEEEEEATTTPSVINPTPGGETTEITDQDLDGPIVSDPNGLPDLVPVVIATGKLVGGFAANNFVATSTLLKTDRIAVKFAIENKGTKSTGTNWRFNVVMPTETTYIFVGKFEHVQNLNPGEKIEYVIGFDRSKIGTDLQIAIAVDQNKGVTESNETNNGAFVKITVTN
ncbi:hypothetical protein COB87_003075 [Candidatus Wolfebacteria bacterium]|nr:hypothetical protein [Candidatus Wolfebacteria bacterium]